MTDRFVNERLRGHGSPSGWRGAGSALTAAEWLLLHAGIALGTATVFFFLLGGIPMAILGLLLGTVLPVVLPQVAPRQAPERLQRPARRDTRPDGRRAAGRTVASSGGRHGRPRGHRADVRRVPPRARRAAPGCRHRPTRSRASQSGWRATTSPGSSWPSGSSARSAETSPRSCTRSPTPCASASTSVVRCSALSAEGRLSGYILDGLPLFVMIYLYFANRDYIEPSCGPAQSVGSSCRSRLPAVLGGWVMSKMAHSGGVSTCRHRCS